jgi:hypothetical protein
MPIRPGPCTQTRPGPAAQAAAAVEAAPRPEAPASHAEPPSRPTAGALEAEAPRRVPRGGLAWAVDGGVATGLAIAVGAAAAITTPRGPGPTMLQGGPVETRATEASAPAASAQSQAPSLDQGAGSSEEAAQAQNVRQSAAVPAPAAENMPGNMPAPAGSTTSASAAPAGRVFVTCAQNTTGHIQPLCPVPGYPGVYVQSGTWYDPGAGGAAAPSLPAYPPSIGGRLCSEEHVAWGVAGC